MNLSHISQIFGFAGGSVLGADHAMVGKPGSKNNQDHLMWLHGRNCSFAVVCDGCSSGKYSEVGAKLAAHMLCQLVVERADRALDQDAAVNLGSPQFWSRVEQDLLNNIHAITRMIGHSLSQTVHDFWLFTIVGALITPTSTFVVHAGDGFYAVNGERYKLEPGEGNSPTYLAYQLSGTTLTLTDPESIRLKVHNAFDTNGLNSLLLGTDGVEDIIRNEHTNLPGKSELVGPIDQFWTNEAFFKNSDMIRRRLALMALETVGNGMVKSGLLKDDTTIIVIGRREIAPT